MQTKLGDGSVMVCGGCAQDAELRYVGDDGKRMCWVGLAVGKRPVEGQNKPETIWCNVVAWHDVAGVLAQARKRDVVLVIGRLKNREYEGKTYTDLVAEYVNVCLPMVSSSGNFPESSFPAERKDQFAELTTDDGDLPF